MFFILLVVFFVLVQIQLIVFAFAKVGIPSQHIFAVLFATLFGSFINLPIKKLPQNTLSARTWVSNLGFTLEVPVYQRRVTILAVNVGGAVIPTVLSIYLLFKTRLWLPAIVATAIMTLVTFRLAKPVSGLGISLPAFVPPLLAALISIAIGFQNAPVIAYISGTVGTLFGADILNLHRIKELGAPVASSGGAGTFDGIFLNGILAVLLSAFIA